MELNHEGLLRPTRASSTPTTGAGPLRTREVVRTFRHICPGRQVRSQAPPGATRHALLGPIVSCWQGWATDPEYRYSGGSGGVLTALSSWHLEEVAGARVLSSSAGGDDPRVTVPRIVKSRSGVLRSSGSRYAPVANAPLAGSMHQHDAVVGKPCEASALRALYSERKQPAESTPLILSFLCAGTPSQHSTDSLLEKLGVARGEKVLDLWYRGRGWPGRFTVTTPAAVRSASYEESWGSHLGPTVQWRCKICADGVGESADISVGDFWKIDDQGYPSFDDEDGVSAVIARTRRGHEALLRARVSGAVALMPIDPDALIAVQPLQSQRRRLLFARLLGALLAGRVVPRFRGFRLSRLTAEHPRQALRVARGTWRRARAERRRQC